MVNRRTVAGASQQIRQDRHPFGEFLDIRATVTRKPVRGDSARLARITPES
jgi:hypothetical protein